jgi:hypothetical protein
MNTSEPENLKHNARYTLKSLKQELRTSFKGMPSNPPRLFVVNEDGSGVELLRDVDLVTYFDMVSNDPTSDIKEEPLPHEPNSTSVTVVSVQQSCGRKGENADRMVAFRQVGLN